MAKTPPVVKVKLKADTDALLAALDDAEDRVDRLYRKLAKVRRAGRSQGGPAAATRETR